MSSAQKLTKKQKKAIAFRERKQGKGKGKDGEVDVDNDVPIAEDQDMADIYGDDAEVESVGEKETKQVQTKAKDEGRELGFETVVEKPKKRKRDVDGAAEEDDARVEKPKRKKKKGVADDGEAEAGAGAGGKEGDKKETQSQLKQRYILFVGNLRYTTSLQAIKAHFAACDPPPTVRLLTPKPSPSKKPTTHKSKGCAFLEFSHRNALQQALKLHQSELEGRMLNVELTAGGGGKSETRTTKLKERNKELFGRRKQRIDKQATDGESIPTMPDRPQRYSATSGIEQAPTTTRTWTVGDSADDGETHRGGKRHVKGGKNRRPRGKQLGTGVNAIPVG